MVLIHGHQCALADSTTILAIIEGLDQHQRVGLASSTAASRSAAASTGGSNPPATAPTCPPNEVC